MTRRWLTLVCGFVMGSTFVATAWGQAATQGSTLAERMAALRRGWAQGGTESTANEAAATSTDSQSDIPRVDSRSLLPNWFGRRATQPPTGTSGRPTPTTARTAGTNAQNLSPANQRPGDSTAPLRTATRPGTGSSRAGQSNQESFTLPGLGGSSLPRTESTLSVARAAGGPDISQEVASDDPVIRDDSAGRANSDRSAAVNSSARHSPGRRTAPHIDPEQLRRELAGSYPGPSTGSAPAARTARANAAADASGEDAVPDSAGETGTVEQEPTPTDTPFTLPVVEQSPLIVPDSATQSEAAAGRQPESSPNNGSPRDASGSSRTSRDLGAAFGSGGTFPSPHAVSPPSMPQSDRGRGVFGRPGQAGSGDPNLLVSNQTPVIATDIRGPRQIMVGREATYRVQLRNVSDVAAEGIAARIQIPSWADVVDTTTSEGTIQQSQDAAASGQLQWQLAHLEGRGSQTLDIRLVPRASRPLELGVSWTLAPVGSRAVVDVQEPKLQINVSGPDDVLFGKPQVFRLIMTNPGTGVAESVKIDLMPPGGGQDAVSSHPLGDLPPGATRTVEVELTAREAGKLLVKAVASAEGGLTADATKEIFCRKPELEVDWRGPETKYVGTTATYFLRVRNPGTAPAENVNVRVTLPEGAEFSSGSEGQSYDAQRREVAWQAGTLAPGDDKYMELKCVVKAPGANQLRISAATSAGDLADNKTAETTVVALADLKLDVSDPTGPVAVGQPAVYEIRVQNRGASAAKEVNIVALFSEGVEPDQVEGAMYTVADGRVSFRSIEELPAGKQLVLRIRAHAVQPGMHVFRAEVLCRDLEIKLAAEETTRFYADDVPSEGGEPGQQAAGRSESFESVVR